MTSYSGLPSRALASVDLPEPFGPIRAWTSPPDDRSTPRRIGAVDRRAGLDLEQGACHVTSAMEVLDLEQRRAHRPSLYYHYGRRGNMGGQVSRPPSSSPS